MTNPEISAEERKQMNELLRRRRRPYAPRTARWDDPNASEAINADLRAAMGRTVEADDGGEPDNAA
jgi:hypothetical protein